MISRCIVYVLLKTIPACLRLSELGSALPQLVLFFDSTSSNNFTTIDCFENKKNLKNARREKRGKKKKRQTICLKLISIKKTIKKGRGVRHFDSKQAGAELSQAQTSLNHLELFRIIERSYSVNIAILFHFL